MEHALPNQLIRPIALGLIKNKHNQYLFHHGIDKTKNERFYRPLGGGIDFGETAEHTLIREMHEELGEDVTVHRFLKVYENIFNYEGKAGHEIVMVFLAEFKNKAIYDQKELTIHEHNGRTSQGVWRSLEEIQNEKANLYPVGLAELIQSL